MGSDHFSSPAPLTPWSKPPPPLSRIIIIVPNWCFNFCSCPLIVHCQHNFQRESFKAYKLGYICILSEAFSGCLTSLWVKAKALKVASKTLYPIPCYLVHPMSSSSPLTPFIQPSGFFFSLDMWWMCSPPPFTLVDQSGTLFYQTISHFLTASPQMALYQQDILWKCSNSNNPHLHIPKVFVPFTPCSFLISHVTSSHNPC